MEIIPNLKHLKHLCHLPQGMSVPEATTFSCIWPCVLIAAEVVCYRAFLLILLPFSKKLLAGEKAQWVKCLLYKPGDLSPDAQHLCLKKKTGCYGICNSRAREAETGELSETVNQ